MTPPPNPWLRLTAAARRAPADSDDVSPPPGFVTRVVAQALSRRRERSLAALIDRLSWRALGAAGLLAVAMVAFNLPPVLHAIEREAMAMEDPVVALLDTR